MRRIFSAGIDGELNGGLSMRRTESKDPQGRQWKFVYLNKVFFSVFKPDHGSDCRKKPIVKWGATDPEFNEQVMVW